MMLKCVSSSFLFLALSTISRAMKCPLIIIIIDNEHDGDEVYIAASQEWRGGGDNDIFT